MRKIEIVKYNPLWMQLFQDEKERLIQIIGENLLEVFHIGSTSVPNLAAKPIIDMLVVVKKLSKLDEINEKFEKIGFMAQGEFGIKNRRFYKKGGETPTHHIHAYQYDNIQEIARHLIFREYLCTHPDVAREYENVKKQAAKKYPHNIEGYCQEKNENVKKYERKALQWFWALAPPLFIEE